MLRKLAAVSIIVVLAASAVLLAACSPDQFQSLPRAEDGESDSQPGDAAGVSGWQPGEPMLTARSEMRAGVVDGIFYLPGGFGGLTEFEAYDPAGDSWTTLAPMPEPAHHMMTTGHGGKVYVLGGARNVAWQAVAAVFVYDPATDEWAAAGPMPERRMGGEAVSLGDFIYLVGGTGGTTAMLRYEPGTGAWNLLPGPSQPREHVAAVVYDEEIWVIGGRWGGTGALGTVEVFDPGDGSWRDGPEMNEARSGFGAAVVGDRIIVAGGEVLGQRPWTALASAEVYDAETGAWGFLPDLPAGIHGMPVVGYDGAVYVLGGSDRAGGIDNWGRVMRYE